MRAIWTDFGGVLTSPAAEIFGAYCRRAGVVPDLLANAMWEVARRHGAEDPMEHLELGLIGEREWATEVEGELSQRYGLRVDMSHFGQRWLEGSESNTRWIAYLRQLRQRGHFVGIVSNLMPSFEPHWRQIAPPEGLFDDLVLSYEVCRRKPERAMFELAASRAGRSAGDCLLVDDVKSHCEAARAAGWEAVHFTTAAAAIDQIESLLTS